LGTKWWPPKGPVDRLLQPGRIAKVISEEHYRKLERMYLSAPINDLFSPEIVVSEGRSEIKIQVRPEFYHAAKAVHGAVYFKMLDDAAFFAANSLVEEVFVLTVSFNLHLLRAVSKGKLLARGRVVQHTPRLFFAESELVGGGDQLVARGSGLFVPGRERLSAEIGYR
jgi:uncharacterized protein (TIGR00369 family)